MTAAALSRRNLLAAAGGLGLTAAVGVSEAASAATPREKAGDIAPAPDGRYPVAPLARESWTLGVAQARSIPVDLARVDASRRDNLNHMIGLIDAAFAFGAGPDLMFFHEFPITGFGAGWTRKDVLKVAIEIPGEETEALAKKAREKGIYIVFGSYARDPAWPGHALSITTIIGPDGRILARDWKARNIKGAFGGEIELFTTTIYDVLDRFVEMYGRDAIVPVTRTPIGNISTSSVQREPELFRAMAIKGAEVILRTATGGFVPADIAVTSLYNGVYTAVANNAISPGSPFFEDTNAGGSAVYGPDGEPLAIARSPNETLVTARIPIGAFRARHRQPTIHPDLYMDVLNGYSPRFPPNLFSDYVPTDLKDAGRYLRDKGRWQ
ncbi:nitrilase-related carbon-nitrogen hydrolase [Edaphosphingomonas haloaromaticamans]|uniref:Aliphatic amidase n=1 Tax=Edaphosphingomonas haloaromaticamans TaxID=653954 RepID=A0A1S1HEH2_9SPHN|nr:nitrilase-related carbon-nitrogen hydrolase [Sphingomonas haloaromaticamans]OHT20212.1 Aliphatic amidase [Sphingomonas haloaromaticamans]